MRYIKNADLTPEIINTMLENLIAKYPGLFKNLTAELQQRAKDKNWNVNIVMCVETLKGPWEGEIVQDGRLNVARNRIYEYEKYAKEYSEQ